MDIENKNDEYFEIKKLEIEKFEKIAKREKASMLRADIVAGVLSVLTSVAFGIKGTNPFLAYVELFTIPMALLVLTNIKTLLILKRKKEELMKEPETINEIHEVDDNMGKTI